jgi:ApaG protein
MFVEVTNGVKISVETAFQPFYSDSRKSEYVFSYTVTIENLSDFTLQLKRRHWFIFDSTGGIDDVEGEGVVGLQPILEPGQKHTYTSGCNLLTPIGKMEGVYEMERTMDGRTFDVKIPSFTLIVPHLLN